MKLSVKAFALTAGLVWGVGLFLLTWWVIITTGPSYDLTFLSRMYFGYRITPVGSLFGLVWGLADGFIGGGIFALLYNFIVGKGALRIAEREG